MFFSALKGLVIPEGTVSKIVDSVGTVLWEAVAYINWVFRSIETDGTIYNDGLGYKNGYRIRSSGAEGTLADAACTGYIPVNGGGAVRISGCDFLTSGTGNAINASDATFTNLGQIVSNYPSAGYGIFANGGAYQSYCFDTIVEESSGVYKWIVPPSESGIAYIRVTGLTADGSTLIVTVNEEITE